MNYFSAPLPFDERQIEKIAEINEGHQKSKINMLYNCLPMNAIDISGLEQHRVSDGRINSLQDLIRLIKKAKEYKIEFTYLLNSVNAPNAEDFRKKSALIDRFLTKLLENDINRIRISNTHILDYVAINFPQFYICSSTSQEYTSIKQYTNFFNAFENVKEVVPSWDVNKNFKFLRSFRELFPEVTLELMVNEGCMGGCPFRHDHHSANVNNIEHEKIDRFSNFFITKCGEIVSKDIALFICLNNIIYPWDINQYNKNGINNFKFVGRNSPDFKNGEIYINRFSRYLDGIDHIESIYDEPIINFNHYLIFHKELEFIKVKDVIDLLPKITWFQDKGHLCQSICGVNCKYCFKCAENLKKNIKAARRK